MAYEIRRFFDHKLMRHRQTDNYVQYFVVVRCNCLAGTHSWVVCVRVCAWLECFSQCLIRKSAAPVEEEETGSNSGSSKVTNFTSTCSLSLFCFTASHLTCIRIPCKMRVCWTNLSIRLLFNRYILSVTVL